MSAIDTTELWDSESFPPNVLVGRDSFIEGPHTFRRFFSQREPGLAIGDRARIYTWTSFSIERDGFVEIGNDCLLVGVQFMCAEHVRVGDRVSMSYYVTIADCDFHPLDPDERRRDAIASAPGGNPQGRPSFDARPVVIEDDVRIGIGAIVLKGVNVGRGASIAAGAVVTTDVPAGAFVAGNPASIVS